VALGGREGRAPERITRLRSHDHEPRRRADDCEASAPVPGAARPADPRDGAAGCPVDEGIPRDWIAEEGRDCGHRDRSWIDVLTRPGDRTTRV
jgi:hypothetical protein